MLGAIDQGIIRTYVTDFPNEKFLDREEIICIPHLGASTRESEDNCAVMAADEMIDYLRTEISAIPSTSPPAVWGSLSTPARLVVLNKNILHA